MWWWQPGGKQGAVAFARSLFYGDGATGVQANCRWAGWPRDMTA